MFLFFIQSNLGYLNLWFLMRNILNVILWFLGFHGSAAINKTFIRTVLRLIINCIRNNLFVEVLLVEGGEDCNGD